MTDKKIKNYKHSISGGFTIIEVMIATTVFLIVVTIGINALLSASVLHDKSQGMRSILDSLSFAMEDISKNMRTGYHYYCITSSDSRSNVSTVKSGATCTGVAFESGLVADPLEGNPNNQWVYLVSGGKLYKSVDGPYTSLATFIQLTPDEVVLDPFLNPFSVLGAESNASGNHQQAFAVIHLTGIITYKGVKTPFGLQTSVSERLLDI